MNKLLLSLVIAATSTLCGMAAPLRLVIETTGGTTADFDAAGLTITPANGKLNVSNSAGTKQLEVAELTKMYFSGEESAISAPANTASETVEAYTIAGRKAGSFSSLSDALNKLTAGNYVIKCGDKSFKIRVK